MISTRPCSPTPVFIECYHSIRLRPMLCCYNTRSYLKSRVTLQTKAPLRVIYQNTKVADRNTTFDSESKYPHIVRITTPMVILTTFLRVSWFYQCYSRTHKMNVIMYVHPNWFRRPSSGSVFDCPFAKLGSPPVEAQTPCDYATKRDPVEA